MADPKYRVPVVLTPKNFTYEDIAKLNPFYDEYQSFWSKQFPDLTHSSSLSMTNTSSGSFYYSNPESFASFERSSSPVMDYSRGYRSFEVPDEIHGAIHSVNRHKPLYESRGALEKSQLGSLQDDDDASRYSYVETPASTDTFDVGPLDVPGQSGGLPRKKLFGEHGWLGDVPGEAESPDKRKSKMIKDFGKKIKQHVGDIAVDMVRAPPNPFTHGLSGQKIMAKSPIPISLNSLSQSKLYSELEFMICSSANNFLFRQYKVGRVSGDSIKRITNFWGSKNRPQVVQFQFDQDTQRRLIKANLRTLNFHGESAGNPVLLQANLRNWKAIVKEMSVRTFCLPDSVIRKHMHDIHKLLEMLGAPFPVSLAFQELQMRTLSLMQEELKKTHHRQSIASVRSTARPTGDASFMP